ncbi:enoyl-CoA hydratase [Lentibacillus sp. L22]|uniref:enoyl-CoA hydratase n=1 Tax=Lentibacillus TaxID=175304 RepID=UPI0022B0FBE5|nr:enoyl-CoA hydratase [Lentibacillus daqui]
MGALTYEVTNHVAILTIQSPPANALSVSVLDELSEKLDEIEKDKTIKVVVLTGKGKFFSAGANVKEFSSFQQISEYQSFSEKGQHLFERIEHFGIPFIAAIHGAAVGGGLELAMACHMRIAAENAKLGLPELTLGIIPGFAGTQRLPRYVGTAKAYEMILSSEPISGKEALSFGLVNRVVDENAVVTESIKLAEKIASKGKLTIDRIMKLIPYSVTESFTDGMNAEAKAFSEVFDSEDAKEGVSAFLKKRKPNFQDK